MNKRGKEDKEKEWIDRAIGVLKVSQKSNVATLFYERYECSEFLWFKWLYMAAPVLLYTVNIAVMVFDGVLYKKPDPKPYFGYINDVSNSICLTALHFLSYYLSGYYVSKINHLMGCVIKKEAREQFEWPGENPKKKSLILTVMLVGGISLGVGCLFTSNTNKKYWVNDLKVIGRCYYTCFLGITWYYSLLLLATALAAAYLIFKLIKNEAIIYEEALFNKNLSVMEITNVLLSTFSYGLFYIVGSVVFIMNDRVAHKHYGIDNAFNNDGVALILIAIVLLLVLDVYLPLNELLKYMRKKRNQILAGLDEEINQEGVRIAKEKIIERRNKMVHEPLIVTSFGNKMVMFLSVLIPLIGVILQAVTLFKK